MTEPRRFLPQIDLEPPTAGLHYQRACIDEAVIELRCEPPAVPDLEALASFMSDDSRYTTREPLIEATGKIDISGEEVTGEASGSVVGYTFSRDDAQRNVHAKADGLGYAWTGPYDEWETFLGEAWSEWEKYRNLLSPTKMTRVGVRYINRFDIPGPHVEIKDYLRTGIDVSPYLPQFVSGYFLQVQIPVHRFDAMATITSTIVPPNVPDSLSLILDIDCWRGVDIDVSTDETKPNIRAVLDDLRNMKNYVFEASITDAARGLIR